MPQGYITIAYFKTIFLQLCLKQPALGVSHLTSYFQNSCPKQQNKCPQVHKKYIFLSKYDLIRVTACSYKRIIMMSHFNQIFLSPKSRLSGVVCSVFWRKIKSLFHFEGLILSCKPIIHVKQASFTKLFVRLVDSPNLLHKVKVTSAVLLKKTSSFACEAAIQ